MPTKPKFECMSLQEHSSLFFYVLLATGLLGHCTEADLTEPTPSCVIQSLVRRTCHAPVRRTGFLDTGYADAFLAAGYVAGFSPDASARRICPPPRDAAHPNFFLGSSEHARLWFSICLQVTPSFGIAWLCGMQHLPLRQCRCTLWAPSLPHHVQPRRWLDLRAAPSRCKFVFLLIECSGGTAVFANPAFAFLDADVHGIEPSTWLGSTPSFLGSAASMTSRQLRFSSPGIVTPGARLCRSQACI